MLPTPTPSGVFVLALFLYVFRSSLAAFQLSKEQAGFWDIIVKFVGGLVAIVGAIVALSKTFEERAKANQAALIESQKPFITKRQEIYFQLVSATSVIGNKASNDPAREKAISQFWLIFWGARPMVADHQVSLWRAISSQTYSTQGIGCRKGLLINTCC
jgi:hypothetical protein